MATDRWDQFILPKTLDSALHVTKPRYEVVPSGSTRGYGSRCEVAAVNLPYVVMRSDGSLTAAFPTRAMADKFAREQNTDVQKGWSNGNDAD